MEFGIRGSLCERKENRKQERSRAAVHHHYLLHLPKDARPSLVVPFLYAGVYIDPEQHKSSSLDQSHFLL